VVNQFSASGSWRLVSLEAKDYSWHFRFSGDVGVNSETLWRFMGAGRVIYTSTDHQQFFGHSSPVDLEHELLRRLAGQRLTGIVIEDNGDMRLSFEGDLTLEFLISSGGYESYNLEIMGRTLVAAGGGRVLEV
jgi:hypothetical protein